MAKKKESETQRLRKFGLVMAIALALLGGFLLWRHRPAGPYLLYAGATFFLAAVAMPSFLAPLEKAWMALAKVLQTLVTGVILVLTFFLVITPMGLLLRLTGKDLLGMKADPKMDSYWVPVEPDGPQTRPDKPY